MQRRTFVSGLFVLLFPIFSTFPVVSIIEHPHALTVKTEYGDYYVNEPVLIELIKSKGMQRLKLIHQYGITQYSRPGDWFNRFDHSVGVFVILRKFGARLDEQIAGLMHDVSHTVFSHVGDFVFDTYFNRYSYQDDKHEWCLEQLGITAILKKYGYQHCCTPEAKKRQRMFENDRPDICADRIEYLIRGGLVDKLMTQDEVMPILDSLYFENGTWIFTDQKQARKLADMGLLLSEDIFGSAWNGVIYTHAANALKHALETGLITQDEIHFSTDDLIWERMLRQGDAFIQESLEKVIHSEKYYTISDKTDYDVHLRAKCLTIDPWVEIPDGIARLSSIDAEYAAEYKRINDFQINGWYIKLH